ncbi:MAG: helix-turn-helix transcriptional regulator [Clostridiales bacterium]|nr:helix-turn-helix transcriptional regulator [Clostridiales bacterium]
MRESFIQDRIALLRRKRGTSARDMSLTLGQSESYINTIENRKALPSMSVFLRICDYFQITPTEFFDEGCPNPEKLNGVIDSLKVLEDDTLLHISSLASALAECRH